MADAELAHGAGATGKPDEHGTASGPVPRPGSDGEHALQQRLGTTARADRFYDQQVLDRLNGRMQEFVASQEMFFLATADRKGECDNSFRAGPPGFLRVLDDRTLLYPEYRGNGVHASLGNLQENPRVGLLLMDFVRARIGLHVNGRAEICEDDAIRAEIPDLPVDPVPGRRARLWVRVRVEEAYIHCAKHIPHLQKVPKGGGREWGTDDHKRKGGDFFGAARDARERGPVEWQPREHELPAPSPAREPVVAEPAVPEPVAAESVAAEPAIPAPAVPEPAFSEPAFSEPAVPEPAFSEPAAFEPAAPEPAAAEPEVLEPVASAPAAFEPAAPEPAAAEPPVTEHPVPEPAVPDVPVPADRPALDPAPVPDPGQVPAPGVAPDVPTPPPVPGQVPEPAPVTAQHQGPRHARARGHQTPVAAWRARRQAVAQRASRAGSHPVEQEEGDRPGAGQVPGQTPLAQQGVPPLPGVPPQPCGYTPGGSYPHESYGASSPESHSTHGTYGPSSYGTYGAYGAEPAAHEPSFRSADRSYPPAGEGPAAEHGPAAEEAFPTDAGYDESYAAGWHTVGMRGSGPVPPGAGAAFGASAVMAGRGAVPQGEEADAWRQEAERALADAEQRAADEEASSFQGWFG